MGKALTLIQQALKLDPKLPMANNELGLLLEKEDKWKEAIAAFSKEIQLNPKKPHGYANRGFSWLMIGNKPKAKADLKKALTLKNWADRFEHQAFADIYRREFGSKSL